MAFDTARLKASAFLSKMMRICLSVCRRGSVHGPRGDLPDEEDGGRHHVRRHQEAGEGQDLQRYQGERLLFCSI